MKIINTKVFRLFEGVAGDKHPIDFIKPLSFNGDGKRALINRVAKVPVVIFDNYPPDQPQPEDHGFKDYEIVIQKEFGGSRYVLAWMKFK